MSSAVKTERRPAVNVITTAEDRELEEWARRLASRPTPQIGVGVLGQQSTLNSFLNMPTSNLINPDGSGIPANNGFDLDSAIGRFTWHTIAEDKYVPCVFRNGEKYCCIRMAEISVIGELLRCLPSEIYDCMNLNSHTATPVEARLLTHINSWHCDGFYGAEPFTTKDLVVRLTDVEQFYYFLNFAYSILNSGGRNLSKDYSKCAFIKVNSDNLIPYTVLPDNETGVPLFYFEGQTDILKEKAVPLSGWELAYLKVCCKVQGVRKDLIAGNTLQIVKVSDLRAYFPKRTVFTEECWPEAKVKSLLAKSTMGNNFVGSQTDKWTKSTPYINGIASTTTVSVSTPNCTTSTTPTLPKTVNNISKSVNPNPQPQATVISNRNGGSGVNANLTIRIANGSASGHQGKNEKLAKIKVQSPPLDTSRLETVPEYSDAPSREDTAYAVRLIIIEKELMHCVNQQPFKNETYLVVLPEFMSRFFPSISIYPTSVSVLRSCGVSTLLPNSAQIRTLNRFGFNIKHPWQMPLIPAVQVAQAMSRLRTVFRPRLGIGTAEAVINNSRTNGYTVLTSSGH